METQWKTPGSFSATPPGPDPELARTGQAFEAFYGSDIEFRPLQAWPGQMTVGRRPSIFGRKTSVSNTISLLRHELKQIDAKAPMIAMALRESEIRRDGYPRSDARPSHPGVIVSFDTPHGRLVYKCDTFNHWHWNIRAIALTLEALRKPDRYGVLKAGEQYTGNRLLTAGGTATTMNVLAAAKYIARLTGYENVQLLIDNPTVMETCYREAAKKVHPDAGGTAEQMDLLTKARETLRAHHGLGVAAP